MGLPVAAAALAAVTGCASQQVAVFHPGGAATTAATPGAPQGTASPAAAPQATARAAAEPANGGFHFPAGFGVRFQAAPVTGPARQAMVAGYEAYVLSFWAGILSHGKDHRYRTYLAGNALTFARRQIRFYTAHHLTIRGTASYSNIKVTNIYFGTGVVVSACVDVSGLSQVTSSGARMGNVYSHAYLHYLEQVAEGQLPDGAWRVIHTDSYPATTSEGAVCQ